MEQSPNLSLSYVMPAQAQKHVTVNESFRRLDALVQARVISRSQSAQPVSAEEGDSYIIPAMASGDVWEQFAPDTLAVFQDGAWVQIEPQPGWRVFVLDEEVLIVSGANGWSQISAGGGGSGGSAEMAALFGINTGADATNRLAVKSDAILFSHDDVTPGSGDLRHVFNKAESARTASLLFQTGFSGRVEVGLLGNDGFTVQVSEDGQGFTDALVIDPGSAKTSLRALSVGMGTGNAVVSFTTNNASPFWGIGQEGDNSFYIQRLNGGFGTGGKVLIYNQDGNLGLWGVPSTKGKISTRSNVNADGVDNILYLEQTALSPGAGIAQFHNNQDNSTPILRCTTNSRTVLNVPAQGSIRVEAPIRLMGVGVGELPSASVSGAGAMVYVTDAALGAVPAFSDGTHWRRVTDRAIVA